MFFEHARNLPEATDLGPQIGAVRSERTLLNSPNPIPPLLNKATTVLRKAVSDRHERLTDERNREVAELEASDNWTKMEPDDRKRILESTGLEPVQEVNIGTEEALLDCLHDTTLDEWDNRILAVKTRGSQAREKIAQLLIPEAVTIHLPRTTLGSKEEVEAYVEKLREQLLKQVEETPVILA